MSVVAFQYSPSVPSITLASGETFNVRKVALYPADVVSKIASMRMQAERNLGGVSTGIGFWGSPTWVIEGALVLGAVENWLSNNAAKEGLRQLENAKTMYLRQMSMPEFFDVSKVENFKLAQPGLWQVVRTKKIDCRELTGWSKKADRDVLLGQYGKTKSDIVDGWLTVEEAFVHNGDDFVIVETDSGVKNVRWSQVAAIA
jgi:hypothetical protein